MKNESPIPPMKGKKFEKHVSRATKLMIKRVKEKSIEINRKRGEAHE